MTKRMILAASLVALMCGLPLVGGCGGGGDEEAAVPAEAAAQAEATVAVHDCDGACGMTNVPEDQLTEIDGKWYCAGCAPKVQEEAEEDHSGHDHG